MMKTLFTCISVLLSALSLSAQNWQLVWSDEFNGTELNLADWNYDMGTGSQYGLNGWGNDELQYYRAENTEVANGLLTISALNDGFGGMPYTSGKIHTKTKQYFTYGKFEARMRVATDQGMWPAFWMLTEPYDLNQNSGGWPPEIDIMESVGSSPGTTHGTAHWGPAWDQVTSNGSSYDVPSGDLSDDFHIFTVEWYPDNLIWYVDGIQIHELSRINVHPMAWQFDEPFFLILNLAVGGNWPGAPDGSTTFPETMDVDWVRAYSYDNSTTTDVTFRVDLSDETLNGGDVVHVNGTWNSWCGACNPLTDLGNGIWETTLPIPAGVHEYKFTTNGWTGLEETFAPGTWCALTTDDGVNTYVNRVLNVQFDDVVLEPVCFNSCELCPGFDSIGCTNSDATNFDPAALADDGSCTYLVEFQVDMNQETLDPADIVYLNSTFNAWCGVCNPMSDPDLDGIWTVSIPLGVGDHEYKFTTNGWDGLIEQFDVGEPCTNTTYDGVDVYTNRKIEVIDAPLNLDAVCFNSCALCPVTNVNITFRVDMGNVPVDADGVHLTGSFQSWDPSTDEMDNAVYGLYELTVSLESGTPIEYLFVNGDQLPDAESVSGLCTNGSNRVFIPSEDAVLDIVCFSSCELCTGCTDPLFVEYNPFAIDEPSACTNLLVEGCTYAEASNFNPLAQSDDGSCVFDPGGACLGDLNEDGVVNTVDLLSFLASFGIICPN